MTERICNLVRSVAQQNDEFLEDDITDDFLFSLFSIHWYQKLEQYADVEIWKKENKIPFYIPHDCWYVWIDGRLEFGSIEYVASEYCKDGLCFDYNEDGDTDFPHDHEFRFLLSSMIQNPYGISFDGHEECYSKQELHFLNVFLKKLREDVPKNYPRKADEPDDEN